MKRIFPLSLCKYLKFKTAITSISILNQALLVFVTSLILIFKKYLLNHLFYIIYYVGNLNMLVPNKAKITF